MIAFAGLLAASGCGNTYRPVVTAISPVGPAGQPQKFAIAISQPSTTGPGLVTIVDFSGDTIVNTTAIGVRPFYLALNGSSTNTAFSGYTLDGDGTINTFSLSTSLLSNAVQSLSLAPTALQASSVIFASNAGVYVTEPGLGQVAQFANAGNAPSLRQQLPVPANPAYIVGNTNSPRLYTLSAGNGSANGQAAAIETATNTILTPISVGVDPVYGVMTADNNRAFVMNRGSNTVSVINTQTNALDATTPSIPVGIRPSWADLISIRNEIAIMNAGDGASPGSVTLAAIPLCNAVALPSNPACNPANPTDAANFGQVLATIPTGVQPIVIAVLSDGSRAYIANRGDTLPCPTLPKAAIDPKAGCGSVTILNLQTNTVEATVPVAGHPVFMSVTAGTPTGKVYVTSDETSLMTVLRTDQDLTQTFLDLQGVGGQVRVTAQ